MSKRNARMQQAVVRWGSCTFSNKCRSTVVQSKDFLSTLRLVAHVELSHALLGQLEHDEAWKLVRLISGGLLGTLGVTLNKPNIYWEYGLMKIS